MIVIANEFALITSQVALNALPSPSLFSILNSWIREKMQSMAVHFHHLIQISIIGLLVMGTVSSFSDESCYTLQSGPGSGLQTPVLCDGEPGGACHGLRLSVTASDGYYDCDAVYEGKHAV